MQDDSWGLNGEFDDIDMDEGAEATGGRAAVQTVPVLFRVAASHARPGGRVPLRVIVFGSVPELGGWKVQQGVAMETDAGEFPVFSAEVALPAGAEVEYSYAVLRVGPRGGIEHVQPERARRRLLVEPDPRVRAPRPGEVARPLGPGAAGDGGGEKGGDREGVGDSGGEDAAGRGLAPPGADGETVLSERGGRGGGMEEPGVPRQLGPWSAPVFANVVVDVFVEDRASTPRASDEPFQLSGAEWARYFKCQGMASAILPPE